MSEDEVLTVAHSAFQHKMGTIMLQSGELRTPQRMEYINRVVSRIRDETTAADLAARSSAATRAGGTSSLQVTRDLVPSSSFRNCEL
jgi:2-iminoacetate synthase ThiH